MRLAGLALAGTGTLWVGHAEGDDAGAMSVWEIIASNFRGTRSLEDLAELEDVTIVHDSLTIEALRGRWNRSDEVAELAGQVRLTEKSTVITCDSTVYWRSRELAHLYGDVSATDGPFRARGDSAWVARLEERVSIFGDARVEDEAGHIHARRIDYDRRSGVAVARERVVATDVASRSTVRGERLVYNAATDLAVVSGKPELMTEGDTQPLHIRAEEMRLDRSTGVADALRDVRIVQGDVHARSGRARFDRTRGFAQLVDSPAAWDSTARITADTLTVFFEGEEIRRLVAIGDVIVVQQTIRGPKVGERLSAAGDSAVCWFSAGVIDSIRLAGRAYSDYIPSSRDVALGSGANYSRADRIHVHLQNGRASRVWLAGNAIGRYWFPSERGAEPDTARVRRRDSAPGAKHAGTRDAIAPDSLEAADPDSLSLDRLPLPATLTVSSMLAARGDSTAAPADSAASDSLRWVTRVESLDQVSPPDTLFTGGFEWVTYAGRTVDWLVETGNIEIDEEASVQYGDAWLRSGHVIFDTEAQVLEATQSPTLEENGSELAGSKMSYDVDSREGVVHRGRTEFDGGYYYGRRIKKLEDETLLGQGCVYTTCDRDVPHFHFGIPSMKIELRERVVGRPVVLYIAGVPVAAVPYFLFPIQRGRRSGLYRPEIEFGFSTTRGRYVRNLGYYWAASQYADAALWFDYTERSPRGWQGNLQSRYTRRYAFDGNVRLRGALNFPEQTSTPEGFGTTSREWSLLARHRHDLPADVRFTLDAEFESSQAFREQQLGDDFTEIVDRLLTSNLGVSKSWSGASLTLRARREQDLEAEAGQREVSWTLPSVSFSLSRRTIGRRAEGRDPGFLPWLSTLGYSYSVRAEQPIVEIKDGETTREFALRHDVTVNDTRSIGPFGVTPRFGYSEFLFEEDNRGRRWQRAGRWNAGASTNTTLYGTFPIGIGPLIALRHVVQPAATFTYTPAVSGATFTRGDGSTQPLYPSVGGISFGNNSRSRRISFRVGNQFQLRVRDGEEARTLSDLVRLDVSTGVNLDADERQWSPLSSSLRIVPSNAFNMDLNASHDLYGDGLLSFRVSSNLSLSGTAGGALPAGAEATTGTEEDIGGGEGLVGESLRRNAGMQSWSLILGHSYSRGRDPSQYTSDLSAGLTVSPTRNWGVSYRTAANLREKEIGSQSFVVTRNLHCWQASFERTLIGSSARYYFRIGVRDIPEIKYEQRR